MADAKITELSAQTSASTDDVLVIVDAPGTTPTTKKITFDNLQKSINTIDTDLTGVLKATSGVLSADDVNLADEVTGTLPIANGGTGQITAQAAIDALTSVVGASSGQVLTKDGSGNATFQNATGGGASAFTDLTDVPSDYTDAASKYVAVNATADGLEFVAGAGVTDENAIHVNAAGEIHAISAKTAPTTSDELVIEDANASYAKKRVTGANLTKALDTFTPDTGSGGAKGLVPAPDTGDAAKFLKADGTWASPAGVGDVATDSIWDAKGDLAVGTGADTATKLVVGADTSYRLRPNSAETSGLDWYKDYITANVTLTVAASGGDYTTIQDALAYLADKKIAAGVTVTIEVDDGKYDLASNITITHSDADKINIVGKNTYTISITSVQSSGSQTTDGSLKYIDYIINVSSVTNATTNDYLLVGPDITGGSNPKYICGCHKITNVDAVNTRLTIRVYNLNSTKASSSVATSTAKIVKTVINLNNTATLGFSLDNNKKLGLIDKLVLTNTTIAAGSGISCINNSYVKLGTCVGFSYLLRGIITYVNSVVSVGSSIISACNTGMYISNSTVTKYGTYFGVINGCSNIGIIGFQRAVSYVSGIVIVGNTANISITELSWADLTGATLLGGITAITGGLYCGKNSFVTLSTGTSDVYSPAVDTVGNEGGYIDSTATYSNLDLGAGGSIISDTTTGIKIGTATSQKLGFFNSTPVVQQTTAAGEATFTENSGTTVNDNSTFGGYTIQQIVKALQNLGFLA